MLNEPTLHLVLSWDNAECADGILLSVNPPVSNNQKSNRDCNSPLLLTMLSTYRACQFHFRLHQCLSCSLLIASASTQYQRDQGQISTPTCYLSQGLRLDREFLHWMSPSPTENGPHSRVRYVTQVTEVGVFPVCAGAWRLMGNEGEMPFVLPLKGPVG